MTIDVQTVFIGGLTLCKRDVATEVMVEVDDSDFETKELQEAFNAIKGYWELRGYVDVVDLRETHKNVADLIVECSKACEAECVVLSRERMGEWAKRIKENAALRRFQSLAVESTSALTTYKDLSEIYQQMGEAMSLKAEEEDAWTYEDVLNDYVLHMDEKPVYIKTGLERLDEALHISPGDFIIIGGRPSAGKTALSLQIAASMAKQNYIVYYFSLETSKRKLGARLMANQIYCPLDTVKNKAVSLNEIDGQAKNMKMPLYIRSAAGKNVAWMKAQALRKKAQIIFVDYLQLIHETGAKDRYAAITAISIALHELAQTTGIVVVALAQLNRNPSKPGATPTNSDLRESGQIEQDADAIILLSGDNPDKYLFRLSKNKEGEIGDLPITFNKQIQRFQEYTWMD
jgi:replicative DNA helicase